MADKNFRFRDLETDPIPKKRINRTEKSTQSLNNIVRQAIAAPYDKDKSIKVDDHQTRGNIMDTLNIILTKLNNIENVMDTATVNNDCDNHYSVFGDDYNAFPDPTYDYMEYYLIDGTIVSHDIPNNDYIIGDNHLKDITLDEVVGLIYDKKVDTQISEENLGYVNRFLEIYAHEIGHMIGNLVAISTDYQINPHNNLVLIEDYLSDAYHDIGEDDIDEDEYDDDMIDEEDDESEDMIDEDDPVIDVDTVTDIEVCDDNNDQISSIDTNDANYIDRLPTLDEIEDEPSPKNLKEYANRIDKKIPDELANEIITRARSARRDRSIQAQYIDPKN